MRQSLDWTVRASSWRLLQFFNVYRLSLNLALWALYTFGSQLLYANTPQFVSICKLYLISSLVFLASAKFRFPRYENQVVLQTFIDIFVITFLVHEGGGFQSGFGCLLLLVMITASILMPGRLSLAYPAIATLCILGEQTYSILYPSLTSQNLASQAFTQSGILGIALFTTSYATNLLSKRLGHSEALAHQQKYELENWEKLNSHIIQHLPAGILVLDKKFAIQIFNKVAGQLLQVPKDARGQQISTICPSLEDALKTWHSQSLPGTPFPIQTQGQKCIARFTALEDSTPFGMLIWVEEASRQIREAHHMKLASLGRLTASIAHEIRNPLSAIRHASQLLEDGDNSSPENLRLVQIIQENASRTNTVIENVLSLSREKISKPQYFLLEPWLKKFSENLIMAGIKSPDIHIEIFPHTLQVAFDPEQLHQILVILCDNGLRYSLKNTEKPALLIKAYLPEGNHIYLDIIDSGLGVTDLILNHLFEPFCSSEPRGTGLGLFIAKGLAEANGGYLSYQPTVKQESCFRLKLPISLFRINENEQAFSSYSG